MVRRVDDEHGSSRVVPTVLLPENFHAKSMVRCPALRLLGAAIVVVKVRSDGREIVVVAGEIVRMIGEVVREAAIAAREEVLLLPRPAIRGRE